MKLQTCTLDQIAQVSLGYKSLQNHFFYVSPEVVDKFGIESKYLRHLYQLADLEANKFKQTKKPKLRVFYCKAQQQDLAGTGALKYIRAMEKIPATERKQTNKTQTIRAALEAQIGTGGTWYMPKALLHKQNIWLRKAFGTVFSPFLFDAPAAVDQRCNYVGPIEGLDWRTVAAVLTSSLFTLSAESFGNSTLGAGALELATTMVRGLRVVDVRGLIKRKHDEKELVKLAEAVWSQTRPFDWSKSQEPPSEVQALDEWLLSQMQSSVSLARLYADVASTLQSRLALAEDKAEQVHKAEQVNIHTVSEGIVETVRPLLESAQFPESFVDHPAQMLSFDFGNKPGLEVECHPMMDRALLVVRSESGEALLEGQYPRSVAQTILKALLLGRRVFCSPSDVAVAESVLEQFQAWFARVTEKITSGCAASAVGTNYEQHVYRAVLAGLHLDPNITASEFYGAVRVNN
jgi:hypothetical protein